MDWDRILSFSAWPGCEESADNEQLPVRCGCGISNPRCSRCLTGVRHRPGSSCRQCCTAAQQKAANDMCGMRHSGNATFPQRLRFNTVPCIPLAPLGPFVPPWPSPVPLPCPSCLRRHEKVDGLHSEWRLVLHQAAGERHGQKRLASHAGHAQHVAGHLQGWQGMDRCGQGLRQGV